MKKYLLRIAAVFVAAVMLASCFAGCGSDDERVFRTYGEIKKSGKIKIGVLSDNNPLSFAGEDGEYQGYEISVAERLADELKVKADFVSVESEKRLINLESGKVDAVIACCAENTVDSVLFDCALPYMKTALGAVSKDDKNVKALDELGKNDRVIVITGSDAAFYMAENYPKIKLTMCNDENDAIDALADNKGVLWLDSNTETAAYANQTYGYKLALKELGGINEIAPVVSKGNSSLIKKLNKAIRKLRGEEFFEKTYDETLADVYGEDFKDSFIIASETASADTSEAVAEASSEESSETVSATTEKTTSKTESKTSSVSKTKKTSKTESKTSSVSKTKKSTKTKSKTSSVSKTKKSSKTKSKTSSVSKTKKSSKAKSKKSTKPESKKTSKTKSKTTSKAKSKSKKKS